MNQNEPVAAPQVQLQVNQTSPTPAPRPLPSAELLRGARSMEITHNGAIYRLQATRLGKLILTK